MSQWAEGCVVNSLADPGVEPCALRDVLRRGRAWPAATRRGPGEPTRRPAGAAALVLERELVVGIAHVQGTVVRLLDLKDL